MNTPDCDAIRDRLPEWVAGGLEGEDAPAFREHLLSCPDCRAEEALLRTLLEGRPEAPEGLAARIQARVREEMSSSPTVPAREGKVVSIFSRRRMAPAWVLSAAALVIVSLGIGVIWEGEVPNVELDPVEVALNEPLPEAWLWDDGMVAGAPVFDGLSDEDIEALIQELEG